MKYEIKNRYTGNIQFTAEIECSEDAPRSVKIGLAIKWGISNGASLRGADLRGANLRGASLYGNLRGADLYGASLYEADLRGVCMRGVDLREVDMRGADLYGADLYGASLRGVNLSGARNISDRVIDGGIRADGYRFILVIHDGERRVIAGCRNFTMTEAREHWHRTRSGTALGDETTLILDHMEHVADLRGWKK